MKMLKAYLINAASFLCIKGRSCETDFHMLNGIINRRVCLMIDNN